MGRGRKRSYRSKNTRNNKAINRNRPASRRSRIPNRPQARSFLGQAVTRGIRSVMTLLPGQSVLKPVADAFFRFIGISDNATESNTNAGLSVEGDASVYAAGCMFIVKYVNILAGSRLGVVSGGGPHSNYISELYEGRLIDFTVSVAPSSAVGKRNGNWTIGFQPFLSDQDLGFYDGYGQTPDRDMILRFLHNSTGSASDKLSVRYVPRPADGWAYQYHTVDTGFGVIALRYEEPNRTGYGEFSSDDFASSIVISGRIECRRPPPAHASTPRSFPDVVTDCLRDVGMVVINTSRDRTYVLKQDKFKCTNSSEGLNCHYKGEVSHVYHHRSQLAASCDEEPDDFVMA